MTHIELVTGKKIIVKETLHEIADMSGPIFKLTMITSEGVWSSEGMCYVTDIKEQEIFLHEDKIVYMYEV